MAVVTITEAIQRGRLSISYAANDNARGALYGKRLSSPISPVAIAMVTDALTWGNDGGAQTTESIRSTANYLVWLCGKYGQQAEAAISGGGGGSVIPGGGGTSTIYPFIITSADFEADGISYNNADIVGDNLSLFINEYSQQWLVASASTFSYTSTGVVINIPGFDANTQDWTIMIQKLNS